MSVRCLFSSVCMTVRFARSVLGQPSLADFADQSSPSTATRSAIQPISSSVSLVLGGVARVDIGEAQQLETAPRKLVLAWPRGDQFGRNLLAMRAQEVELVRLRDYTA